ncbi:hypothetical protein FRB90_003971, partial [Tulasnella sp. 427]
TVCTKLQALDRRGTMSYQGFGLGLGASSALRSFGTQEDDEFGDSGEPQVVWQSSQVANIRALLEDKRPASKGKDRAASSRRVSASSSSSKSRSKASRRPSLPVQAGPGTSAADPILIGTQESPFDTLATPSKLSSGGSSVCASASSTPAQSTSSSGPSNSFTSSEWDFFPPCFGGSSRDSPAPHPGPVRRTKDQRRLRSRAGGSHRQSLGGGEGMEAEGHEEEGEEHGVEGRSTSVDSLQAMLRQFGTAVKERAAREVEVPTRAKDVPSRSRLAPHSRRREEVRGKTSPRDRTNGRQEAATEVNLFGRTETSDVSMSVEPSPARSTIQQGRASPLPLINLEEPTRRTSPAPGLQKVPTFKEPLPPSKRDERLSSSIKIDMPPPPVPRRPSPLREEQILPQFVKSASPVPPPSSSQSGLPPSSQGRRLGMTSYAHEPTGSSLTDSRNGPNSFKSKSIGMRSAVTTSSSSIQGSQPDTVKRTNSNRLPTFQPPIKKSVSPTPPPPPPPAPAPKKSAYPAADEDGDVSMTNSVADTSFGNSFEIDPGELDAIMSPYEQTV